MKWALVFLALASCSVPAGGQDQVEQGIAGQDTLPEWVTIITDQQTKCEYLVTAGGHAMVPRLGRGGHPICATTPWG